MVPLMIAIGVTGVVILFGHGLYRLIGSAQEDPSAESSQVVPLSMFSDDALSIVKRPLASGMFRSIWHRFRGGGRRLTAASPVGSRSWPWRSPALTGGAMLFAGATLGLWAAVAVGALGFVAPSLLASRRRAHRRAQFLQQFPAALDMMSRSLRAGHALIESIRSVAEDSPDPIGEEFRSVVSAVQYGMSLPDALKDLAARVDSGAMKFFVTSLVLQRETGGNLVQIIDFISRLTRRQFEWEAKLRALSAEGRFSVNVLLVLPVAIGVILLLVNPDYLRPLVEDPAGRMLLLAGGVLALLGVVVTKRMVRIEV